MNDIDSPEWRRFVARMEAQGWTWIDPRGGDAYQWRDPNGMYVLDGPTPERPILKVVSKTPRPMTDTQILDWLERNLCQLSEASNPQMDGTRWFGSMRNEARGSGGGAGRIRIQHPSIRQAVEDAARWTKPSSS